MRRVVVLAFFAVTLSACSEPLEFAEWTIPVPEGTKILGYAHVPDEERTDAFALERNLVLTEAFGRPLYEPRKVAVAADGTIFVLDAGNHRVVAFDGNGTPLHEFGQEGQGPGEFGEPNDLVIVGDSVIVNDVQNGRFSVFQRNGTHVTDHVFETRIRTHEMRELDGDLLLVRWEFAEERPDDVGVAGTEWMIARHKASGEEMSRPFQLRSVPSAYFKKDLWEGTVPISAANVSGVIGPGAVVLVTNGEQYQVLSLASDGSPRWALRTTYRPVPVGQETKNEIAKALREQWESVMPGFDLRYDDIHFPDHYAAIEGLEVDGRGNLYVFPFANRAPEEYRGHIQRPVPVDVYSADGEPLFSGMIEIDTWEATLNDDVYRVETDPDTEEQVVARYRLVQRFK